MLHPVATPRAVCRYSTPTLWRVVKGRRVTICYHTTNAADAILRDGFRDATGVFPPFGEEMTGVFLCEQPVVGSFGRPIGAAVGEDDQVLQVEFSDDFDLGPFVCAAEPPRTWHMPAAQINEHANVTLLSDEEVSALLSDEQANENKP